MDELLAQFGQFVFLVVLECRGHDTVGTAGRAFGTLLEKITVVVLFSMLPDNPPDAQVVDQQPK